MAMFSRSPLIISIFIYFYFDEKRSRWIFSQAQPHSAVCEKKAPLKDKCRIPLITDQPNEKPVSCTGDPIIYWQQKRIISVECCQLRDKICIKDVNPDQKCTKVVSFVTKTAQTICCFATNNLFGIKLISVHLDFFIVLINQSRPSESFPDQSNAAKIESNRTS